MNWRWVQFVKCQHALATESIVTTSESLTQLSSFQWERNNGNASNAFS